MVRKTWCEFSFENWWVRTSEEIMPVPYYEPLDRRAKVMVNSAQQGLWGVRDVVTSVATLPYFPNLCSMHETVVENRVRGSFGNCEIEGGLIGDGDRSKEEIQTALSEWLATYRNEQKCGFISTCQCSNENSSQSLYCREDETYGLGTRCVCLPRLTHLSPPPEPAADGIEIEDILSGLANVIFVGGGVVVPSPDSAIGIDYSPGVSECVDTYACGGGEDAVLVQYTEIGETRRVKFASRTSIGTDAKDRFDALAMDRHGILYATGTTEGAMAPCRQWPGHVVSSNAPRSNCGDADVFVAIWAPAANVSQSANANGYVEFVTALQLGSGGQDEVAAATMVGGFHEYSSAAEGFEQIGCMYERRKGPDSTSSLLYSSTNTNPLDPDFCSYKEMLFVVGSTLHGGLGRCSSASALGCAQDMAAPLPLNATDIFVAALTPSYWETAFDPFLGTDVEVLQAPTFEEVTRMGLEGTDVPVAARSGAHGGAWVVANSHLDAVQASTAAVRCAPDACASGWDILVVKLNIRGEVLDAARVGVGDSTDEANSIAVDLSTGSVYIFGHTQSFGECHASLPCDDDNTSLQRHLLLVRIESSYDGSGDASLFSVEWAVRWHLDRTFGDAHYYQSARAVELLERGGNGLLAVVTLERRQRVWGGSEADGTNDDGGRRQLSVNASDATLLSRSTPCASGQMCGGSSDVGLFKISVLEDGDNGEEESGLGERFLVEYDIRAGTKGSDVAVAATRTNFDGIAVVATVSNPAIDMEPLWKDSLGVTTAYAAQDEDIGLLAFASLRCASGEEPREDIFACGRCDPGQYSVDGMSCEPCNSESSECVSEEIARGGGSLLSGVVEPISKEGWQRVVVDDISFEFERCHVASDGTNACDSLGDECAAGHRDYIYFDSTANDTLRDDRLCAACARENVWSRGKCVSCSLTLDLSASTTIRIGPVWRVLRLAQLPLFALAIFSIATRERWRILSDSVRCCGYRRRQRCVASSTEGDSSGGDGGVDGIAATIESVDKETVSRQHYSLSIFELRVSLFRVVLSHFQLLLVLVDGIVVPWPSSAWHFFLVFDSANTVAALTEALDCIGGLGLLEQYGNVSRTTISAAALAVGLCIFAQLFYSARILVARCRRLPCCSSFALRRKLGLTKPTAADFERAHIARLFEAGMRHGASVSCVWIGIVSYLPLARLTASALACRSVYSRDALLANPAEDCLEWPVRLGVGVLLLTYVAVYPHYVRRLVDRHENEVATRPWLSNYAYAWPHVTAWRKYSAVAETTDMFRQLAFAVVLPFLMRNSEEQIVLAILGFVLTSIAWSFLRPFRHDALHNANMLSTASLTVSLFVALTLRLGHVYAWSLGEMDANLAQALLSTVVVCANVAVVAYAAWEAGDRTSGKSSASLRSLFCRRHSHLAGSEKEESNDRIEMHVPHREFQTSDAQTDPMSEAIKLQYELRREIIEILGELRKQYSIRSQRDAQKFQMEKKTRRLAVRESKHKRVYKKLMRRAEDLQLENFKLFAKIKKLGALEKLCGPETDETSAPHTRSIPRLESVGSAGLERLPSLAGGLERLPSLSK
eukprot:g4573.t1